MNLYLYIDPIGVSEDLCSRMLVASQTPNLGFVMLESCLLLAVCSEKLKMLRACLPPSLQELKLDLRWLGWTLSRESFRNSLSMGYVGL